MESTENRKIPAEPQTMPDKAMPTINHVAQRQASADVGDERQYLHKDKYLRNDIDTVAESHEINIECGMTFQRMKVRINEFTMVAPIPMGACL